MSAADSDESRRPDFATASIRTQWMRSTVAYRSSSSIEGRAALGGAGLGVGNGLQVRHLAPLPGLGIGSPLGLGRAQIRSARAAAKGTRGTL